MSPFYFKAVALLAIAFVISHAQQVGAMKAVSKKDYQRIVRENKSDKPVSGEQKQTTIDYIRSKKRKKK